MTKARDIASAAPAPAGVTSTELGYVDGVTSAIQTQIDSKPATASTVLTAGGSTITVASGTTVPLTITNDGTGNSFVVNDITGDVGPFVVDASGNVGIGNAAPSANLQFSNTVGSSGAANKIKFYESGSTIYGIGIQAGGTNYRSDSHLFYASDGTTERMRIDSSGNTTINSIADATTTTAARGGGYMGIPQSPAATTGSYTIVAADAGEHIYSTATRTITIPANASVAFPVGTAISFVAASGATVTIAITSDTLLLAGPGTTGSRTLAPFGMATALKITSTSWIISGNGLT